MRLEAGEYMVIMMSADADQESGYLPKVATDLEDDGARTASLPNRNTAVQALGERGRG